MRLMNEPWRTVALVVLAVIATVVPLSPFFVETWYSRGLYLHVQRVVTPASNLVPIALLDVTVVILLAVWLTLASRRWRARGSFAAIAGAALWLLRTTVVLYLLFLALWGLNYRRAPLESKLAYDPARVTREATRQFAAQTVERLNVLEKEVPPETAARREALEGSFARAQRYLGATRTAATASPKRSMVSWYLSRAGIDGMMNPIFLEIILNPEVLAVERPFSLAHEWAHLAGYADESEANFVAWLTSVGADAAAQYSGWLEAFRYATAALPRDERADSYQRLSPRVVADLRAINERLGRADPTMSGFARNVYDSYLRAQGVDEGIDSYGAMLRLMLGTTFDHGWVPKLR